MRNALGGLLLGLVAASAPPMASSQELTIDHAAIQCVVAERFPRFEARVPDLSRVARARIHFRPETSRGWYSVEMKATPTSLAGVLPRPKKSLASFRYYIEVTDTAFASVRTPEQSAVVADTVAGCAGKLQAATETTATVILVPSGGLPPVPSGFSSTGVTAAAKGAAGGATASGGGIGGTALVIGGVVVAAGAALAVSAGGGGGDDQSSGDGSNGGGNGGNNGGYGGGNVSPSPNPSPSLPTAVVYDVFFEPSPPGIDVSSCLGRAVGWCCQPISVTPDGTFNDTWSVIDPNTMRVTGSMTSTTVNGTMTCVAGGASGSFSATNNGGTYRGSFDFRGQRGTVSVVRK